MSDETFETWAAGIIYNDQPLPERGGIPYFLAEKAYRAGVAEGIRKAFQDARVEPEFTYYLPNDGEFEYTSASDCDGSNVKYWRRLPKYVGSFHPWEPATEEQYRAAKIREEATDGSA